MITQTFKEFLESVQSTKRTNITHLEQMKPVEFVEFARKILIDHKGQLKDIPIDLKVDGMGCRFGRDTDGKFFFETSRSGPINTPGAFSAFNKSKGTTDEVLINRAKHYDDLYDQVKSSPIWYHLPIDSKVICEILYNPMATLDGDGLRFVSIKYDTSKLGKIMTIVPFTVITASTGEPLDNSKTILGAMRSLSTKDILVIDPDLGQVSLDVELVLKPVSIFDDEVLRILQSRKRDDQEKKLKYNEILNDVKSSLAKQLLTTNIPGKDKLGNDIEGFVLKIGDKQYKVTTSEFKDSKKKS